MSDTEEKSPSKAIKTKQQMKLKNTTTFKSKTRLQKLQNLPQGDNSPHKLKFKSPAAIQKHKQLNNEEESEDKKPKAKKKTFKATVGHSGVPPNPKLRQAFQGLKAKLENMKS